MNLYRLSVSYLKQRPMLVALNVLLLALGVATLIILLLFHHQVEENMKRDARPIDLVVGAKGSPLQLILSSVYHMDAPTGNISIRNARFVTRNSAVRQAIPLSMGDSYAGFPIIGTVYAYPALYGGRPQDGGRFWRDPYEVVIGADVARVTALRVGDEFASVHGLSAAGGHTHDDAPLRVVGVLRPTGTVVDRLMLTSLETVWMTHAHDDAGHDDHGHDHHHAHNHFKTERIDPSDRDVLAGYNPQLEITSLLVQYANPRAAVLFPRAVNGIDALQAAAPAMEIARLFNLLGIGAEVIRMFGFLLFFAALFSLFVTLYTALKDRLYDLAMLRTLGASPRILLAHVLVEGLVLTVLGVFVGIVSGHVGAEFLGQQIAQTQRVPLTGWVWLSSELWVIAGALGVGALASLLPAWKAYRTDPSRILATTPG